MKNRIKVSNKVKPRLTVATKKVKKAVSISTSKSKKGLKKATEGVAKTVKDADNLLKNNLERIFKGTGVD